MRFNVQPPSRKVRPQAQFPYVLEQDAWDDFGFKTQYQLYVTSFGVEPIGSVKILKKGQQPGSSSLITQDFDSLPENCVSVGASLDYYENLGRLGADQRAQILDALRDVATHPELQSQFETEDGWKTSLFRSTEVDEFLMLARALIQSDYTSLPSLAFKFSFGVTGWQQPLTFDFAQRDSMAYLLPPEGRIPERLIVLIGRNGSGKSTLLARLARVAHGTAAHRDAGLFAELGEISPPGVGFPRIITVSYSAFDSFTLPGLAPRSINEPDQRAQIVKDVRNGEGRFVFCGLRDIASELEADIRADSSPSTPGPIAGDRVKQTLLKSIDLLGNEFAQTIEIIRRNHRWQAFVEELDRLVKDSSFSPWERGSDLASALELSPKVEFEHWSSGQKIVVQIVASLVAHVTARSLVLIDEPETHLHPPLIAALMHSVRHVLNRSKAYAIVATHSPIVLQESLARDVFIVRRDGSITNTTHPTTQTFGENVGTLTSEAFSVNSEVTDFHRILDSLVGHLHDLDKIEELFAPHGLSMQARAYVMSLLRQMGFS